MRDLVNWIQIWKEEKEHNIEKANKDAWALFYCSKNEKRKKERKTFAYSIEFVVIKEYTIVVLKKKFQHFGW